MNRKWRVVIVKPDGKRVRYGGGISGRGQGIAFVSEQAARHIADEIQADLDAHRADPHSSASGGRCYVEEFDYIPPAPPGRPHHLPTSN